MNKAYVLIPLIIAAGLLVFPFIIGFGNSIMVVSSDSMLPVLYPYDIIIVQKEPIKNIKVDEIVVFNSHTDEIGIIAHRAVVKLALDNEVEIHTKGDNVSEIDPWTVYEEDLIGKVINVIPRLGILLIDPIRYSLVAVIIITGISFLKEISTESKIKR